MPEYMTCFACENEPTQQCSRCGRPYCDDHGEELCDVCLHPASGVPSFTLYRGSMLALLIGVGLAVWLLVQPPGSEGEGVRPLVVTPTPVTARGLTTPAAGTGAPAPQTPAAGATQPAGAIATLAPAGGSPVATRPAGTPPAGTTPAASGTPAAGATSTAGGVAEYTVASGDTISGICERQKPASMTVPDCVDRVIALNNLSSAGAISIGDKLRVPR